MKIGRKESSEKYKLNGFNVKISTVTSGPQRTFIIELNWRLGSNTPESQLELLDWLKQLLNCEVVKQVDDLIDVKENIFIAQMPESRTPKAFICGELYFHTKNNHTFLEMKDTLHQIVADIL